MQSAPSASPPLGPRLTLQEGSQLPPPDLSTGRQLMTPVKGQPMLLSSCPGPAHSSPRKETPLSRKETPSTPSLPLKGGQSSLNIVPRDGSLRREELVGEISENEKQGSNARNRTKIGRLRGGKGGVSAEADAEGDSAHRQSRTT